MSKGTVQKIIDKAVARAEAMQAYVWLTVEAVAFIEKAGVAVPEHRLNEVDLGPYVRVAHEIDGPQYLVTGVL